MFLNVDQAASDLSHATAALEVGAYVLALTDTAESTSTQSQRLASSVGVQLQI